MKDIERITGFLHAGHHGSEDTDIPSSAEPIPESMIRLNLDQLTLYDRNPRIQPNQDYAQLKASLMKTGATKVLLTVTRRPGETLYFPAAGGNTRLTALKELYQESNDEQFYWINCKFIAYADEMQLIIAHLSENDNRSDYLFIDRARAICELYEDMSRSEGETLTQREFIQRLNDMGYPKLNRTYLDLFLYTKNHLYPYIPSALDAGMGPRKIQDLRRLQKDLNVFFGPEGIGSTEVQERFRALFPTVLSEQDSDLVESLGQQALANNLHEVMTPIVAALMKPGENQFDEQETSIRIKNAWTSYQKNPDNPIQSIYPSVQEDSVFEPSQQCEEKKPSENSNPKQTVPDENNVSKPVHPSPLPSGSQGCWIRYRNLTEDILSQVQKFATDFKLDQFISPFLLEKPIGNGFWIDLPDSDQQLNEQALAAWRWLWDLSGLTTEPGAIADLIVHDPQFAQSRIAGLFRALAESEERLGQSENESMPQRDAGILKQLIQDFEAKIPKSETCPAEFLRSLSDLQYSSLIIVVELVRGVDTIINKIDSNDS